jgi:transcriptional regulator with XRE-family HTH domain
MAKKTSPLLPSTMDQLRRLGDRLRLARLRRKLSAKQVAERAGMSLMTLRGLERGGSGVTIGAYAAVMQVLGIEKDIDLIGKADELGRELQDAKLSQKATERSIHSGRQPAGTVAAPASKTSLKPPAGRSPARLRSAPQSSSEDQHSSQPSADWINQGGFTSSKGLAKLLDVPHRKSSRKRR